jgi:hypothetical protein
LVQQRPVSTRRGVVVCRLLAPTAERTARGLALADNEGAADLVGTVVDATTKDVVT